MTALLDYPDDEDRTQSANRESEAALYEQFVRDYHIDYFAGSYRYQIGQQKWFAGFSYQHQQLVVGKARPLMILDRIGSGDAFASGIITGLIEGWSLQKTTDFAIATAVLAQATVNDAPEFTKEMVLADMASDGQLELIR
ncbi:PfkB family carbohydrate kinase [Lactiplantibacillus plantarum]|uniref:PfkB family carbohydrate kinase n=1 Tax=Lactiplantibacillus plantarum TaxID=1590 RepID=UPI001E2BF449|nr:PfkB family carbohydrate kinase [Lactiplantibacillus plantarum]MCG0733177.1 2-keto-3-deoxygluconate kinase [Lactiplantibacillus plantarum]UNF76839.1 PfkB family carbohydrate kinase [Lactiplantibacillus plantarum]